MKKISKRFLTLAITCVMAMAMAVPAFADWTIEVDDNSNRYINVYGTYGSSLNAPARHPDQGNSRLCGGMYAADKQPLYDQTL